MSRHNHVLFIVPVIGLAMTLPAQPTAAVASASTTPKAAGTGTGAGLRTGAGAAAVRGPRLPLGASDLPEVRRSRALAKGVTWTTIRRGVKAAPPAAMLTTLRGPWAVNIVSIDPRVARGRLAVTVGADLRRTERTSALARAAGALVAVNGGFFAFTAQKEAPGDPIGLGVLQGTLTSEPMRGSASIGLTVDTVTNRLGIGAFSWSATLRAAPATPAGAGDGEGIAVTEPIAVTGVNRPPGPDRCQQATVEESGVPATPTPGTPSTGPTTDGTPRPRENPTAPPKPPSCIGGGDLVRFTGHWGAHTPAGLGTEVIVDRDGCVLRSRSSRGGPLSPAHVSYQATGPAAGQLLALAGAGCLRFTQQLRDGDGRAIPLKTSLDAVNGRQVLVRGGRIVETRSGSGFAGRNPRTIVGRTARGVIALITIDGRRTTSVGASLAEAARLAKAFGLVDAVNLDGGGSTTMAIRGQVVNTVAGRSERAVSDALVYVPR